MADSIIQWQRGDPLEAKDCAFCGSTNNCTIFGIESGKRHDGILLRHFSVCEEHREKLNALLSGEYDIDRINLEKLKKVHIGRGIRLR